MPIVALIAVGTLHKDRILAQAFGKDLAVLVAELEAAADVMPCHLRFARAIHVGEHAQTEALRTRRIRVAVDGDRVHVARHVEHLAHALLHLVVGERAPIRLLDHRHRHHVERLHRRRIDVVDLRGVVFANKRRELATAAAQAAAAAAAQRADRRRREDREWRRTGGSRHASTPGAVRVTRRSE